MKKSLLGIAVAVVSIMGLSTLSASAAPTPVNCTLTASPTTFAKGVATTITLHYTSTGANTLLIDSFAQQPALASGNFTRTISQASRFTIVVYDYATGNAHLCVASVSTYSHTQPD